jgi:hypothetical protein
MKEDRKIRENMKHSQCVGHNTNSVVEEDRKIAVNDTLS